MGVEQRSIIPQQVFVYECDRVLERHKFIVYIFTESHESSLLYKEITTGSTHGTLIYCTCTPTTKTGACNKLEIKHKHHP